MIRPRASCAALFLLALSLPLAPSSARGQASQGTPHSVPDPALTAAYARSLPQVAAPAFDEPRREMLASMGISCADHPQENIGTRNNYLWQWEKLPVLLDNYDRSRAFFGCSNWHDAAGTTWALMSLLQQDPKIPLASSIRDIANTHFRPGNMTGEYNFFAEPRPLPADGTGVAGAGLTFEQPYGYAWLLKLYGENKASNTADGRKLSGALAQLARWMSEKYVFYLYNLKYAFKNGNDQNTAWAMSLALDGANLSEDTTLQTAIKATAVRLYGKDRDCAVSMEPQNSDNVSACLTEAALMGRSMEGKDFVPWLGAFLPPVYMDVFQVYAHPVDISHTSTTGADAQLQQAARARLVALEFQRAWALLAISYALPADDARVAIFRSLAAGNARDGYEKFNSAGYEGEHILPIYALLYENEAKGPAPLGPPNSKPAAGTAGANAN